MAGEEAALPGWFYRCWYFNLVPGGFDFCVVVSLLFCFVLFACLFSFLKMLESTQPNKVLKRSQLTCTFNWHHMTPPFNITPTSVRGHPPVPNPRLLPRNVERVIFCLCRAYLVLSFPASKQTEAASVNWKKKQFPGQRRHYPTSCRCFNNALEPG